MQEKGSTWHVGSQGVSRCNGIFAQERDQYGDQMESIVKYRNVHTRTRAQWSLLCPSHSLPCFRSRCNIVIRHHFAVHIRGVQKWNACLCRPLGCTAHHLASTAEHGGPTDLMPPPFGQGTPLYRSPSPRSWNTAIDDHLGDIWWPTLETSQTCSFEGPHCTSGGYWSMYSWQADDMQANWNAFLFR